MQEIRVSIKDNLYAFVANKMDEGVTFPCLARHIYEFFAPAEVERVSKHIDKSTARDMVDDVITEYLEKRSRRINEYIFSLSRSFT